MYILTLRTDNPQAEIGIFDGDQQLAYEVWEAHRALSDTIHHKLFAAMKTAGIGLQQLQGIVVFKGPGSFTGLRIGITVANTLAYAQKIAIVGSAESDWREQGLARILQGDNDRLVIPEYGAAPNITKPKH